MLCFGNLGGATRHRLGATIRNLATDIARSPTEKDLRVRQLAGPPWLAGQAAIALPLPNAMFGGKPH